ncbi:hypothetical protein Dsin_001020 [Dipteronia sinensis]|uniref:Transposase n=1 Tax=Dipteronia sinensis TaxID=43782 RepID=A0AAE0B4K5_9ROSI|nr:hypothetical protein Dsin_001020 [Dipteronia sinensis]
MARNWLANMLFDDDSDDEFQLLAITVIEEKEEMENEGRTSRRRGSIPGHAAIQRDRVTDSVDEYMRIDQSTIIKSLKKIVKAIIAVFGDEYLRSPNNDDITRLLEFNSRHDFPGMLRSIDCMHWKWKNCPVTWQGMYSGHIHEPTIILEAVASYDLWIWHAFFGLPRFFNDINVLERYTFFNDLAEGHAPLINYSINSHEYTMGYYLVDDIYPSWLTFVKTIPSPKGNKNKHFAVSQESARKDVEHAFGVLQSHFAIVRDQLVFGIKKHLMMLSRSTINYIHKDFLPEALVILCFKCKHGVGHVDKISMQLDRPSRVLPNAEVAQLDSDVEVGLLSATDRELAVVSLEITPKATPTTLGASPVSPRLRGMK